MIKKVEFGDFQTNPKLVEKCINYVSKIIKPSMIIEPTCGLGFFLEKSYYKWKNKSYYYGCELNKEHLDAFKKRNPDIYNNMNIFHEDFFSFNLNEINFPEKTLVIGNPPWVTNSKLGTLNSSNLPKKNNDKKEKGISAITGKSNFDISETIISQLCEEIRFKKGVLAMLCKTSVARKVFLKNYKKGHNNVNYQIIKINAQKEFKVNVDACLFIVDYLNGGNESKCNVLDNFNSKSNYYIGIINNKLISNIDSYIKIKKKVNTGKENEWRSGLKHDAAKVMELSKIEDSLINGFGEKVNIEEDYLFPLLKSSDLAKGNINARKFVIVTQRKIGQCTKEIKDKAPNLWKYLNKYKDKLDGRKSIIYKKQPQFAMFGLGSYSFKPYKIVISGFYHNLNFCLIKDNVMIDDTCYQLGFSSLKEAKKALKVLRSDLVKEYIYSIIFKEDKRPITIEILNSIDINYINSQLN